MKKVADSGRNIEFIDLESFLNFMIIFYLSEIQTNQMSEPLSCHYLWYNSSQSVEELKNEEFMLKFLGMENLQIARNEQEFEKIANDFQLIWGKNKETDKKYHCRMIVFTSPRHLEVVLKSKVFDFEGLCKKIMIYTSPRGKTELQSKPLNKRIAVIETTEDGLITEARKLQKVTKSQPEKSEFPSLESEKQKDGDWGQQKQKQKWSFEKRLSGSIFFSFVEPLKKSNALSNELGSGFNSGLDGWIGKTQSELDEDLKVDSGCSTHCGQNNEKMGSFSGCKNGVSKHSSGTKIENPFLINDFNFLDRLIGILSLQNAVSQICQLQNFKKNKPPGRLFLTKEQESLLVLPSQQLPSDKSPSTHVPASKQQQSDADNIQFSLTQQEWDQSDSSPLYGNSPHQTPIQQQLKIKRDADPEYTGCSAIWIDSNIELIKTIKFRLQQQLANQLTIHLFSSMTNEVEEFICKNDRTFFIIVLCNSAAGMFFKSATYPCRNVYKYIIYCMNKNIALSICAENHVQQKQVQVITEELQLIRSFVEAGLKLADLIPGSKEKVEKSTEGKWQQ